MQTSHIEQAGVRILVLHDAEVLVHDLQSALDLLAVARYEHGADAILLRREQLSAAFFDLRSGLAGEILQKFTTYQMKIGVCGDFSRDQSKALQAFIYEANQGKQVCFVGSVQEALAHILPDRQEGALCV